MNTRNLVRIVAAGGLLLVAGCSKGKGGSQGTVGDPGPTGPVGPVQPAPVISQVWPKVVTPSTKVRIRGTGFSPTVADDTVFVNGTPVTVLTATGTEIWATGFPTATSTGYGFTDAADLSVSVIGEISNVIQISLGNRGATVRAPNSGIGEWTSSLLEETGDSSHLLVAEEYFYDNESGYDLGAIDSIDPATGALTPVLRSREVYYIYGIARGPDGNLYFGAESQDDGNSGIYRLNADGTLSNVVGSYQFCGDAINITWDPAGNLFFSDTCSEVNELATDGTFYSEILDLNDYPAGLHSDGTTIVAVDQEGSVFRGDSTAVPATWTTGNGFCCDTVYSSVMQGSTLLLLTPYGSSGLVQRMTTGGDVSTVAAYSAFVDDYYYSYYGQYSGSSLSIAKDGTVYFPIFQEETIVRVPPGGVAQSWFLNPSSAELGYAVNGAMYYFTRYGCEYGARQSVMKQGLDGTYKALDLDVCNGYQPGVVKDGLIYIPDVRGRIMAIDPTSDTAMVASADSAMGYPLAVTLDASNNFLVATYDGISGSYEIIKLPADGTASSVVATLPDSVDSLAISGGYLYASNYSEFFKVKISDGTVENAIPQMGSMYNLEGVSALSDGSIFFTGPDGNYVLAADGTVSYHSPDQLYFATEDEFGALSGLDSYDYTYTQVLQ